MLPAIYFLQDLSESSKEEMLSDEEFVPESGSDLNSDIELDLEIPISNITESSLDSSSLNGTPGDSFIQNLSSSNDSSPNSVTEAMDVSIVNKMEKRNASIPKDTSSDSVSFSHDITTVSKGGQNFCFVCGKAQNKIARHFKVHENEDAEIAQALSFPAHSKKRKELLQALRNKGNFMHNNNVLKKGTGVLKVKRCSVKQDSNKYEYCIYCHGMFVREELWRHMKRCSAKRECHENYQCTKRVLGLAAVAKAAFSGTVSDAVLKLVRNMRDDEIVSVVQHDPCLLQFAQSLYNKHGRDLSRHGYIRQKICNLGRFLISIRKNSSITTLEDAIKPVNFMATVQAAKELAGFSKDEKTFDAPSLALKIGQHLLQVSSIIRGNAIIAGNKELSDCMEQFQTLYRAKWTECVSCTARMSAKEKKCKKKVSLPLTEDMQKLTKHLENALDSAYKNLEKSSTIQNYSDLARVTLTRVILFNRRQSGEVSKMQLKNFLDRDPSLVLPEFGLSNYEKRLCSYLSRVEFKGKKDRKVAILLTPDLVKALQLLVEKRKDCEVFDENGFLFALPKSLSFFRGHDCIRKFAQESGARHPEYLRSTQLRKQVATTSQILNLKNNEMDRLADFLGHDISVHQKFYRLPAATLQITKMSKLLLALERDNPVSKTDEYGGGPYLGHINLAVLVEFMVAVDTCIRTSFVKRPWTKLEEQAVFRHFKTHILKGRLATLKECHSCKRAERRILHSRTPQNIRDFVRNRGTSLKRQNALKHL
ncbi:Catalase-2 [Labeo rohita]|uniref:Catalase-2 n=1 Tax=Labeo rohita TaxID=84645 RepID=A0ABQ8L1I2_LABRO|nr:Catalase-2 [Labeo rohita]